MLKQLIVFFICFKYSPCVSFWFLVLQISGVNQRDAVKILYTWRRTSLKSSEKAQKNVLFLRLQFKCWMWAICGFIERAQFEQSRYIWLSNLLVLNIKNISAHLFEIPGIGYIVPEDLAPRYTVVPQWRYSKRLLTCCLKKLHLLYPTVFDEILYLISNKNQFLLF